MLIGRRQGGLIKAGSEEEYVRRGRGNEWTLPKSGMKDNRRKSSLSEGEIRARKATRKPRRMTVTRRSSLRTATVSRY